LEKTAGKMKLTCHQHRNFQNVFSDEPTRAAKDSLCPIALYSSSDV
jgi:hypothetical protein